MRFAWLFAWLLLSLSAPATAKGQMTRIAITGSDLTAPVEITDQKLLDRFNPWAGRGAVSEGVEQMRGFIVDWIAGALPGPPDARHLLDVRFYVRRFQDSSEELAYAVSYAYVPSHEDQEAVYLPGKKDPRYAVNVKSIFRKTEGKWFRPTSEWQRVARPLIARALSR